MLQPYALPSLIPKWASSISCGSVLPPTAMLVARPGRLRRYARAPYRAINPMARNASQTKCRPRDTTRVSAALTRNVTANTADTVDDDTGPWANKNSSAPAPHHATLVRCQAKRSVRTVNSVPPKSFGKSSRRNRRIRMYFSPRNEWAMPTASARAAASRYSRNSDIGRLTAAFTGAARATRRPPVERLVGSQSFSSQCRRPRAFAREAGCVSSSASPTRIPSGPRM